MESQSDTSCGPEGLVNNNRTDLQLHLEMMNAYWNHLSSSLLSSISLLAQVVTYTAKLGHDFTGCRERLPSAYDRYRFVLDPECFLLFVWRIINVSKVVFDTAFNSMAEIAKLTRKVPRRLQEISLLRPTSHVDIRRTLLQERLDSSFLPIASNCYKLARDSFTAFESLTAWINKVLDVCDATKSPAVLRSTQREAINDLLQVKLALVDELVGEALQNFNRSERHHRAAQKLLNEVLKNVPNGPTYFAAHIIDRCVRVFLGTPEDYVTLPEWIRLEIEARIRCASNIEDVARRKRSEDVTHLIRVTEHQVDLQHLPLNRDCWTLVNFEVHEALKFLEQANTELGCCKKLAGELMDYFETVMKGVQNTSQAAQIHPEEIPAIFEGFQLVHERADAYCKVWNDNFRSSFQQMESLTDGLGSHHEIYRIGCDIGDSVKKASAELRRV